MAFKSWTCHFCNITAVSRKKKQLFLAASCLALWSRQQQQHLVCWPGILGTPMGTPKGLEVYSDIGKIDVYMWCLSENHTCYSNLSVQKFVICSRPLLGQTCSNSDPGEKERHLVSLWDWGCKPRVIWNGHRCDHSVSVAFNRERPGTSCRGLVLG